MKRIRTDLDWPEVVTDLIEKASQEKVKKLMTGKQNELLQMIDVEHPKAKPLLFEAFFESAALKQDELELLWNLLVQFALEAKGTSSFPRFT